MLEIILFPLSGLFLKISDDAHDRKNNAILGITSAVICGFSIGYLAINSSDAACIFLAILIGTLAAWKVDCLNHFVSLFIFLAIIFILGFPAIGLITLLICAIAAFLDEIGNDSKWSVQEKHFNWFFKYRFALKTVVFVFAILGLLEILYPYPQMVGIQFFSPFTLIYFLLFEISYELMGLKFNTLYDGLKNFLGIFRSID